MSPNSLGVMPGGVGRQYTYGTDEKGLTYIFDKSANKMVYYGSTPGAQSMLRNIPANGGRLQFEGSRFKGGSSQASVAGTPQAAGGGGGGTTTASNTTGGSGYSSGGGGGGSVVAPKVLDQAQLDALQSLLGGYDTVRDVSKRKASLKRDASLNEKKEEFGREEGKYKGKKVSTLQGFAGAKTDTDLNTTNTLENLISSLSTVGLGGARALTRRILDAANMANRKANATQATDNQSLDTAFNEYKVGNENDTKKIEDQFGYDTGEADKEWGQNRQNTLYKMADVYNAADRTDERASLMGQGNDLSSFISKAAFVNPKYTGEAKTMATPELGSYTQDIAKYDTSGVGGDASLTPAGEGGAAVPGNLAIKAIALNDKDLGIKKKTEGDLGYGA